MKKKYCTDCIHCIGGWANCYCELSGDIILDSDRADDLFDPCDKWELDTNLRTDF